MPTYVEDTTDGGQDRATKYYYIIPTYEGLNESYLTSSLVDAVLRIPPGTGGKDSSQTHI